MTPAMNRAAARNPEGGKSYRVRAACAMAALFIGGERLPIHAPADAASIVPAIDSLSVAEEINTLVGPFVSSSSVAARGGVYARYEFDFVKYDEEQWKSCGPKWDCINYYDRAMIYYVWWQRTRNAKYRDRANAVAVRYRSWIETSTPAYCPIFNWFMTDGLALHYVVTRDTASLVALGKMADWMAYVAMKDANGYFATPGKYDARIQAYAVKTLLLAYRLHAPSVGTCGGVPGGNDWAAVLRTALSRILAAREADGQWRYETCGAAGRRFAYMPYMQGLLYDALSRYYTLFEQDPRIVEAVSRSADEMWTRHWLPAPQAFDYVEANCPRDGTLHTGPAADVNNLIVNGFGWLYHVTGDAKWRTRADAIFAGAVNGAFLGNAKQFNQQYTSSYRYLGWR